MNREDWIIATCNSNCDGVELYRFFGTETEVRTKLVEMVKEDAMEDSDRFDYGTETVGEVVREYDGRFSAYGTYSNYHIDYSAQRLDDMCAIL